MQIAQRATSSSSITTTGYYTVDRFKTLISSLGTFTQSQSTDVPTGQGFANSLKLDCTTADASPAADDYLLLQQLFEGQNLQYLKKGTANALPLTLSFWVKSVKTGTYIAGLFDSDNTRQISKSYTINSASTWEYKSVTFAGDTTGTLDNDNGKSLVALFFLGGGTDITSGTLATSWESYTAANRAVGQVNIADNTANDWYITGVQLEAGSQASGFEFMPVDTNLARCYRYFQKLFNPVSLGYPTSCMLIGVVGTVAYGALSYLTTMRTTPTFSTSGNLRLTDQGTGFAATSGAIDSGRSGPSVAEINFGVASGLVQYRPYNIQNNSDATASINLSAEL
jgi:hypothetical protein